MENRTNIRYSEAFKRSIVEEVESGKIGVAQIAKRYGMSYVTVYRWMDKYGKSKKVRIFIQNKTEIDPMTKLELENLTLKKQLQMTESVLAQTQVKLVVAEAEIEVYKDELGREVKKSPSRSSPSSLITKRVKTGQ